MDTHTTQDTAQVAQDTPTADQDTRITTARTEAAKYRKRAQEAEEALAKALDIAETAIQGSIGLYLKDYGVRENFLWDTGHDPFSFLTDDGIDTGKVAEAIVDFEERMGATVFQRNGNGEIIRADAPPREEGATGQPGPAPTQSWADALR